MTNTSGAENRQCYILQPLHDKSCKIMTPVDNPKVIMRSLISKEETRQLLKDIPEIETLPEQGARQQELAYQKALHSCDCREWICLVKTLTRRMAIRRGKGKKVTATDDRYFKAATEKLVEEFSVVLGMDTSETKELLEGAFTEK
jgi:CarD family transcriptional regulator